MLDPQEEQRLHDLLAEGIRIATDAAMLADSSPNAALLLSPGEPLGDGVQSGPINRQ